LAKELPVRLVVVGEGPARDQVAALATEVNDRHGADVVVLTGGLVDPRPAYEAADVMFGMGGSALRSMAFGKPLVVFGERGFSRTLDRSSADWFLRHGWYGLGDGDLDPAPAAEQLRTLAMDPRLRVDLGAFGRDLVVQRYGLEPAARGLADLYGRVVAGGRRPLIATAGDGARTAALVAGERLPPPVRQRVRTWVTRSRPGPEGGQG
jgi:glycosyltransferase involved in cell wall biosynthesis